MDAIAKAAETAQPLFRLNQWTWRDETKPPTLLDIAATYSSLMWSLRREYGWRGDGVTHFASTGRLVVIMSPRGDILYSVATGREH